MFYVGMSEKDVCLLKNSKNVTDIIPSPYFVSSQCNDEVHVTMLLNIVKYYKEKEKNTYKCVY